MYVTNLHGPPEYTVYGCHPLGPRQHYSYVCVGGKVSPVPPFSSSSSLCLPGLSLYPLYPSGYFESPPGIGSRGMTLYQDALAEGQGRGGRGRKRPAVQRQRPCNTMWTFISLITDLVIFEF